MYGNLVRNEEHPLSSPSLQTLQNLELESIGFSMLIDQRARKVFLPPTEARL